MAWDYMYWESRFLLVTLACIEDKQVPRILGATLTRIVSRLYLLALSIPYHVLQIFRA